LEGLFREKKERKKEEVKRQQKGKGNKVKEIKI